MVATRMKEGAYTTTESVEKLSCSLVSLFIHKQAQTHNTADKNRNKYDFQTFSYEYIPSYFT